MAMFYDKSRYLARQKLLWGAISIFVLILGYAFVKDIALGTQQDSLSLNVIAALAAGVLVCGWLFLRFKINYKRYESGIRGEIKVGSELRKLDGQYAVFHGLELPNHRGDIDFVVVGPFGVFTIEVKNHSSVYNIDINKFISQSSREAVSLKQFLLHSAGQHPWVEAIVVFSNPKMRIQEGFAKGVRIVMLPELLNAIQFSPFVKQQAAFDRETIVAALKKI